MLFKSFKKAVKISWEGKQVNETSVITVANSNLKFGKLKRINHLGQSWAVKQYNSRKDCSNIRGFNHQGLVGDSQKQEEKQKS